MRGDIQCNGPNILSALGLLPTPWGLLIVLLLPRERKTVNHFKPPLSRWYELFRHGKRALDFRIRQAK